MESSRAEKLDKIRQIGETVSVEFKRCGGNIEHDVYETVCSFSNRFGGDIYLVRNHLQRAPEEDIGWRYAYERLETSILRINIANGECITIDQR